MGVWQIMGYITIAFIIGGLVIASIENNEEKEYRYRQINNLFFLIFIIVCNVIMNIAIWYVSEDKITAAIKSNGLFEKVQLESIWGMFLCFNNIMILGCFSLFKKFTKNNKNNKNNEDNKDKEKAQNPTYDFTEKKHIGYHKIDNRVYLLNDWKITKKIFNYLRVLSLITCLLNIGFILFSIYAYMNLYINETLVGKANLFTYFGDSFRISFYPVLGMLVFNEIYCYLDGNTFEKEIKAKGSSEIEKEKKDESLNYRSLYDKYKKIWGYNLLACNIIEKEQVKKSVIAEDLEKYGNEVKKIHSQLENRYELSPIFYQTLNDMFCGENILIEDVNNEEFAPILFSYLENSIINGKKILVLIEKSTYENYNERNNVKKWFSDWFEKLYKKSIRNIATFDEWKDQKEWNIVIGSQEDIIKSQEDFIRKIKEEQNDLKDLIVIVINEKTNEIAENIVSLSILSNILNAHFRLENQEDIEKSQYIIFSKGTSNLKDSIDSNLGIQTKICSNPNKEASNLYAMIWKTDVDAEYYTEIIDGTKNNMGVAATLSYLAWDEDFKEINFVDHMDLPYKSYQNNVERNKAYLKEWPINKNNLKGSYINKVENNIVPYLIKKDEDKLIFVEDSEYNIALALKKYDSLGTINTFVNVISSNYLLRDYFVDNIKYFYKVPLQSYTPKIEKDKYKVAAYLKEILINNSLDIYEDEVRRELKTILPNVENVQEELIEQFKSVYNIDLSTNYLKVSLKNIFNFKTNKFEEKKQYRLDKTINDCKFLKYFENFEIVDTGNKKLGVIMLDYLYQNFIPGQVHTFDGNSYKVENIDLYGKKINVIPIGEEEKKVYRNRDMVEINSIDHNSIIDSNSEDNGKFKIDIKILTSNYKVKTLGFYEFQNKISMKNSMYSYQDLENLGHDFSRNYENGRILSLSIASKEKNIEDKDNVALALTIVLKEIFRTLFPGNYKYMKIFTLIPNNQFPDLDLETEIGYDLYSVPEKLSHIILSKIKIASNYTVSNNNNDVKYIEENSDNKINIYFLEDTHKDIGILKTIIEKKADILSIIQDYLAWLNEKETPQNWNKDSLTPEEKREYLKFGDKEIENYIKIDKLTKFLSDLLGEKNSKTDARLRGLKYTDENKDEFDKEYEYLKMSVDKNKDI